MEESRKLSGKDLITIGIFSAIYFMLNLAAMFTGFVPVLWLLLPGVTGIVTGIPFLLMTAKVKKTRGSIYYGNNYCIALFRDWSVYSIVTDYICYCMYIVGTVQVCDKV